MGGEIVATDVRDCSNQTTIAGSRTRGTQKYLLYENCVEGVLTSVIEIITLPIMATVWPELMVLYHAESVNSCLDCVVRSFGLIVMFLEKSCACASIQLVMRVISVDGLRDLMVTEQISYMKATLHGNMMAEMVLVMGLLFQFSMIIC